MVSISAVMRIRIKFMHIRQKEIPRDPPSFLGMPLASRRVKNCFGAKKDKYTSDLFALDYDLF